jgi:hypothetical protein
MAALLSNCTVLEQRAVVHFPSPLPPRNTQTVSISEGAETSEAGDSQQRGSLLYKGVVLLRDNTRPLQLKQSDS